MATPMETEDWEYNEKEVFVDPEADVKLNKDVSNIVAIDGLPRTKKVEALSKALKRLLAEKRETDGRVSATAIPFHEGGFIMPVDPATEETKGHCFIEFNSSDDAESAVGRLNGYAFDKLHSLSANTFNDFDRFMEVPEEAGEFQPKPFEPKENPYWWLLDPLGRDQYAVRVYDDTEVYWNDADPTVKPQPAIRRNMWADPVGHQISPIGWSPHGTYFVALKKQGVRLYCGSTFQEYRRKFMHADVRHFAFSPRETYLLTWSNTDRKILLWNVQTGKKILQLDGSRLECPFPQLFKWTNDEKHFFRLAEDAIIHYQFDSTGTVFEHIESCPSIRDFSVSPSDPILAYWAPEKADKPARVVLLQIPTFKELQRKALYNIRTGGSEGLHLFWQNQGDFLAVGVDRISIEKKTGVKRNIVNFEIFRMREKDYPVETFTPGENDIVQAFAWEPKGRRFGVVHCPEGSPSASVSFFLVQSKKDARIKLLHSLKERAANRLFWSPRGQHVVIAGLQHMQFNGKLEFFDVTEGETTCITQHDFCTNVEWDPSGRYVTTFVSANYRELENGYMIWSFQGSIIAKVPKSKFWEFLWRPRPPTLLTAEKEKLIKDTLKEKIAEYEQQETGGDESMRKKQIREEFESWHRPRVAEYLAEAEARAQLLAHKPKEVLDEVEEIVEEVVEVKEVVLQD